VLNSFDKQINQVSTPLHHQPDKNLVKGNHHFFFFFLFNKSFMVESLSNELDREMEHETQKLNATTTKHVTIVEPPTRPTASVDDFSRTNKTISG
jgi:hypothetical protein